LPLLLDPIERGVHDGAIGLELRISDVVTKAVVQRKDPPQRPQGLVGLVSHARRQHAQCDIRIVPEQRGDDRCPQGRTELLVEIVFQSERSLPRGGVTGIERRRRIALFERGDDLGRIADRPAVQEQDGQRTVPRRTPRTDQIVGAKHLTVVRDTLAVERRAGLLAVVRERDVPQQGRVHRASGSLSRASTVISISIPRCRIRRGLSGSV